MQLSPQEWRIVVDVVQFAATSTVGVFVWLSSRDRVRAAQLGNIESAIDRRIDSHAVMLSEHATRLAALPGAEECGTHFSRIAAIEARAAAGPTHGDIARVHQRLDTQVEALATLGGGVTRIEHLVNTLHQHLLDHAVVSAPSRSRRTQT